MRFGRLIRMTYPVQSDDAAALRSGELDPEVAIVCARGVPYSPDPDGRSGLIMDVEWLLQRPDPCAVVTFWMPGVT